jgi:hypothetical protein
MPVNKLLDLRSPNSDTDLLADDDAVVGVDGVVVAVSLPHMSLCTFRMSLFFFDLR